MSPREFSIILQISDQRLYHLRCHNLVLILISIKIVINYELLGTVGKNTLLHGTGTSLPQAAGGGHWSHLCCCATERLFLWNPWGSVEHHELWRCSSASPNSSYIFFQIAVAIISLFSVAPWFLFEFLEEFCFPSAEVGWQDYFSLSISSEQRVVHNKQVIWKENIITRQKIQGYKVIWFPV